MSDGEPDQYKTEAGLIDQTAVKELGYLLTEILDRQIYVSQYFVGQDPETEDSFRDSMRLANEAVAKAREQLGIAFKVFKRGWKNRPVEKIRHRQRGSGREK
jgi:hypothetical protein